ncbi:hypothetical protein SteCoe_18550 [Stentor coeruleus]|uniref:PCI domain-containing protein n=1 Tax=Stentor coeruleus TaxID=5963 RepID=A0A1R2BWA3_9CILI|nr:hypothetical protein SteCoe_18550 [Stentor coeruleus]
MELISRYSDVNQMVRGIYFLSEYPPSQTVDLAKFLINKSISENRINFYKDIAATIKSRLPPNQNYGFLSDEELVSWEIKFKEGANQREYKITQSKNAGLKDSYRVNILELGGYYYNAGDMNNSLKLLLRAKDLTVTAEQQYELCLRMAFTSLYKKNISFTQNNAQKVLGLVTLPEKSLLPAAIIMGICSIDNGNYKTATEYFLRTAGDNSQELACNSDLAAYICICALASMDRKTISNEVIQSKAFITYSEEEPKFIELLECFLTCKFNRLIQILEDMHKQMILDVYIGRYMTTLCDEIKSRCLIQFMKAFKKIRISELALNFACSDVDIEEKLAKLITDGKIDARIDAHQKTVMSRQVDEKNKVNRTVLNVAKSFMHNTQLVLLRMSMLNADVVVRGK